MKCFFFSKIIDELEHVMAPCRLQVAQKTTEAIRMLQYTSIVSEMMSFLGFCDVYRRLVPSFVRLASPLKKKPRKEAPRQFKLSNTLRGTMDVLKKELITQPVLALPQLNGHYTIDTDACDSQVACVLLQEQEDKVLKLTGYWSCSFCDVETRYGTTHKERLAVVCSVLLVWRYLEKMQFIIRTSHQALQCIVDLKEQTGLLAHWRPQLMKFDFEIVFRPGLYHQVTDAMSRLPKTGF